MSEDKFSAENHKRCESAYFEDLAVGEEFYIPSRTVTESHFAAFQVVSGDNHPLHYDVEYCKRIGHPNLLAHGYQVLSAAAAGAGMFPYRVGESLMAFIEQSSTFLKPVYLGDTLYPMLVLSELKPQRTTGVVTLRATVHNQRNELCLEGYQKYLVRRRNPASQVAEDNTG